MLHHDLPSGISRHDCAYLSTFAEPEVYTQGGFDLVVLNDSGERYDPEKHTPNPPGGVKRVETVTVWLRFGYGPQSRIGSGPVDEAVTEAQATLLKLSEKVRTSVDLWINRPNMKRKSQ